MRYGRNTQGEFLSITQENGGHLYPLLFNALFNKKDDGAVVKKFIEFLSSTGMFRLKQNSFIRLAQMYTEDNYLPELYMIHIEDQEMTSCDDEKIAEIITKCEEEMDVSEINAELLYGTFLLFASTTGPSNMQIDAVEKYGEIPDSKAIRKAKELAGEPKKEKLQNIYEIKCRDMLNLKDYAEYFFIQSGKYYIKARPGVMLDDFYQRANIVETSKKRILTDQFC